MMQTDGISIHAPREGGDQKQTRTKENKKLFQSTPPARGATGYQYEDLRLVVISIHAPREGGDNPFYKNFRKASISIHAPREGGDANRTVGR